MARQGLGTENCCNKNQASVLKPDILTVDNRTVSFSRHFHFKSRCLGLILIPPHHCALAMGITNDIYLVVSVYTPSNVCWQSAKEFSLSLVSLVAGQGHYAPEPVAAACDHRTMRSPVGPYQKQVSFFQIEAFKRQSLPSPLHPLALLICRKQQGSQQCWRKPGSVPPPWLFDLH